MAKTFNRAPNVMSTPSSSDIRVDNFTQVSWKGVMSDKNFLNVDQESFADAKNVYVNSEGLLRSRPSCKPSHVLVDGVKLTEISNIYYINEVIIYESKYNNDYVYLTFVNGDKHLTTTVSKNNKYELVGANGDVYLFLYNKIQQYSVSKNVIYDVDVYIPTTKATSGVKVDVLDAPNELTTSYKEKYLFNFPNDVNYSKLYGKDVVVKIEGEEYDRPITPYSSKVFLEKQSTLTQNNFKELDGIMLPMITVSDKDTVLVCEMKNDTYYPYYSADGIVFNSLPEINVDSLGGTITSSNAYPKITKDGNYAYLDIGIDIYVYSLTNTGIEGQYFTEWTPLIKTLHSDYEDFIPVLGRKLTHVDSINNFVVYYIRTEGQYVTKYVAICDDGKFYKKQLSDNKFLEGKDYCTDKGTVYDEENIDYEPEQKLNLILVDGDDNICTTHKLLFNTNDANYKIGYYLKINNYTFSYYGGNSLDCEVGTLVLDLSNNTERYIGHDTPRKLLTADSPYFDLYKNSFGVMFPQAGKMNILLYDNSFNFNSDIEYTRAPEYCANTFDGLAKVECNFNKTSSQIVLDAGAPYLLQIVDNDLKVTCLPYDVIEEHSPICNGLYIKDGIVKYSKSNVIGDVVTEFAYNIKGDYVHKRSIILDYHNSDFPPVCIYNYDGTLVTTCTLEATEQTLLMFNCIPISYNNKFYACTYDYLYANTFKYPVEIDMEIKGTSKHLVPEHVAKSSEYFFSKGNKLYISENVSSSEFKWYFPNTNTFTFDSTITNVHPLSSTEVAVFTEDSIYYIRNSEDGYIRYKSNIPVGCAKGNDVITTYDGKYVIFASDRGVVAMTYQQFVATEEQYVVYLTDYLFTKYKDFYTSPIKIIKYLHWLICYKEKSTDAMVYDFRTSSWWFMQGELIVERMSVINNKLYMIADRELHKLKVSVDLYEFSTSDNDYFDYDGKRKIDIPWYIESQILYLGNINYVKNLRDLTITSVLDSDKKLNFNLQMFYYRKTATESKESTVSYKVDSVRTFVKHINAMKLNSVKYKLIYDADAYGKLPLSISSINLKYKITRQVR